MIGVIGVRIEHYDFGTIIIDGKCYTNDLKILRGRIIPNWWRREGHVLNVEDVEDILEARPRVLVVGTGFSGLMSVAHNLREELEHRGIKLIAMPTRNACEEFNSLAGEDVAFAAHLTC